MNRYLFDQKVAAIFLGLPESNPVIPQFFEAVRQMLDKLVAAFLVDYATLTEKEFDTVFSAYKEFYALFLDSGTLANISDDYLKSLGDDVYAVLLDPFFYDELEKRVHEYYKKIYDQYIPKLSDEDYEALKAYIAQKNSESNKKYDAMLAQIEEGLQKSKQLQQQIEMQINAARKYR